MTQYQLEGLNNAELVMGLSDLVRRSNELTAEVLAHLADLEARMLHLELGYSSAFAYCVQALGLSEAAAGRRLTGARVCRQFPEAFALVAAGELHLSALCELRPHLTAEMRARCLKAVGARRGGKSRHRLRRGFQSLMFGSKSAVCRRRPETTLAVERPLPVEQQSRSQIPSRAETSPQLEMPPRAVRSQEEGGSHIRERGVALVPEQPREAVAEAGAEWSVERSACGFDEARAHALRAAGRKALLCAGDADSTATDCGKPTTRNPRLQSSRFNWKCAAVRY
jgi:hypothetical protein